MYFLKSISSDPKDLHRFMQHWSTVQQSLFAALMAAIAAILQAAGTVLPGIGIFFSPFATLPLLLSALLTFRLGLLTYVITVFLLFVIEPSELFIFPFTTGLLGLGLGWTFRKMKRRFGIILLNGVLLTVGICFPLFVLDFPVLGPTFTAAFNLKFIGSIFAFSFIYSWIWLELGVFFTRRIKASWR
ncbi:hypothetical protein [Sporosarcina sp. HYO08]|uniref:hypothetical protein n=1 Tax=Sporosarcina sp. HYO08 TaxID=1759557 RepID=UPI000799720F|nr:hypothetical protein [Sporosarcina sp. HYO08]KXH78583.1 hypothetical protein AU377_12955 [Sporosarcina sp. HYO08]